MSQMLFDQFYRCRAIDEIDSSEDEPRYYVSFRPTDIAFEGTTFAFSITDPERFTVGRDYRFFIATKDEE